MRGPPVNNLRGSHTGAFGERSDFLEFLKVAHLTLKLYPMIAHGTTSRKCERTTPYKLEGLTHGGVFVALWGVFAASKEVTLVAF